MSESEPPPDPRRHSESRKSSVVVKKGSIQGREIIPEGAGDAFHPNRLSKRQSSGVDPLLGAGAGAGEILRKSKDNSKSESSDAAAPDEKKKSFGRDAAQVAASEALLRAGIIATALGAETTVAPEATVAPESAATAAAGPTEKENLKKERLDEKISQKPVRRPKKVYHNSYRLEPHIPYTRDKVQKILDSTLEEMIGGYYYSGESANDLSVKIAEKLRSRVLGLKFDRYKIVCFVNVGPLNRQGLHIGFRCLMDPERDTYNYSNAKSFNAFVSAAVYAVYFE